jgi:L-seryl-tRNA(Ser) seleniumtransferase
VPDPRRRVPRTDALLRDPKLAAALERLGHRLVKQVVAGAQSRCREGEIEPSEVLTAVIAALPDTATTLRPVINATGVVIHTNLGRAPLSAAAVEAIRAASGTTDVELDLGTGRRGRRGRGALEALRQAAPDAQDAMVVNNGAAALALAACALAGDQEIVISRGELVEIGDGFRIPELLEAAGAVLREVGTTNRVRIEDYAAAIGPETAFVLKVHPSNFVVDGFTASVPVRELAALPAPVVVDIGSGLLARHPRLPDEPDATSALRAGASLVTASGDKLLGGPQCGLVLGRRELVERLRRHPVARAMRVDKLTLAGLEATLTGPVTPVQAALATTQELLLSRADAIARAVSSTGVSAQAVRSEATVGGGGAPGVLLPSAAVALPADLVQPLRTGDPAVLGRVERNRLLLDLVAVPAGDDERLTTAVRRAIGYS